MRERTLKARIQKVQRECCEIIAKREKRPATAFWLSFADETGFKGAVIVHAENFMTALMEANVRGINPHGECRGLEIPEEKTQHIPESWKNRILSRKDCEDFDAAMFSMPKVL